MGLGIPPLKIKILLESNPLTSRILIRRLAVGAGRPRRPGHAQNAGRDASPAARSRRARGARGPCRVAARAAVGGLRMGDFRAPRSRHRPPGSPPRQLARKRRTRPPLHPPGSRGAHSGTRACAPECFRTCPSSRTCRPRGTWRGDHV